MPELLSLRRKLKKYENFSIALIHFSNLVSSMSLQRNVFRSSNFQLYCFTNYLPLRRRFVVYFLHLFLREATNSLQRHSFRSLTRRFLFYFVLIVFHVAPRFLFLHGSRLGTSGDSSFDFVSALYLSISLTGQYP